MGGAQRQMTRIMILSEDLEKSASRWVTEQHKGAGAPAPAPAGGRKHLLLSLLCAGGCWACCAPQTASLLSQWNQEAVQSKELHAISGPGLQQIDGVTVKIN